MTKKGDRSKKEKKLMDEGLEAIYGKDQVDFTTMDRGRSRFTSTLLTVVVTLAMVAVFSWVGFFLWNKYFAAPTDEIFILNIETEKELVSGEQATIEIAYQNPNSVPLASLSLQVNLPKSFEPLSISPAPDDYEDLIWEIGSMSAGSDGKIVIAGTWIAEVPSSTPVQVFASYRPANFNADFSEIETVHIDTLQSVLTSTMEGPEEAQPGEELSYTVEVENTGEEPLENVLVNLNLPEGFFLEESDPTLEDNATPSWPIEEIAPGEKMEILFSGTFAADVEGFHYFQLETGITKNESTFTQSQSQTFTDVLRSNLTLQLVANGGNQDVNLSTSENLRITASLENTGESAMESATLLLDFESELPLPIVWNDAELDGGTITSQGIRWSADAIGSIAPGEKNMFNLILPIDSSVGTGQADRFTVVAHSQSDGFEIRSSPISVQINTEADFTAVLRYFDEEGIPLGSGPLPPEVGEMTVYRLYWKISNSLHDLKDVEISATLPPHVTWMDTFDTDLGTLTFDSVTRTLTWKIDHLPNTVTEVGAHVSLRIQPEEKDLGKFVKIISGSSMKATDAESGATLTEATESLTTELVEDEFAEGKGVVVE